MTRQAARFPNIRNWFGFTALCRGARRALGGRRIAFWAAGARRRPAFPFTDPLVEAGAGRNRTASTRYSCLPGHDRDVAAPAARSAGAPLPAIDADDLAAAALMFWTRASPEL
ncbi:MAG: hypothetical protein H6914_00960 [Novosphingobium sp.]|nr:hypothetical protein [Novosphingobium sp.]